MDVLNLENWKNVLFCNTYNAWCKLNTNTNSKKRAKLLAAYNALYNVVLELELESEFDAFAAWMEYGDLKQ